MKKNCDNAKNHNFPEPDVTERLSFTVILKI